ADKQFKKDIISRSWQVYANIPRIKREKRSAYWETVSVNPNQELIRLFEVWGFVDPKGDIKQQIITMDKEGLLDGTRDFDGRKRNFWQSFIFLFNLILQVRNSTSSQYKRNENGEIIDVIEGVDF